MLAVLVAAPAQAEPLYGPTSVVTNVPAFVAEYGEAYQVTGAPIVPIAGEPLHVQEVNGVVGYVVTLYAVLKLPLMTLMLKLLLLMLDVAPNAVAPNVNTLVDALPLVPPTVAPINLTIPTRAEETVSAVMLLALAASPIMLEGTITSGQMIIFEIAVLAAVIAPVKPALA